MLNLMHMSESGNSASGEMAIHEAVSYTLDSYGSDAVAALATHALFLLSLNDEEAVAKLLGAVTPGTWLNV